MSAPTRPLPQPMEAARDALHTALADRLGQDVTVVPVGATDAAATLGDRGAPDPWVHLRAAARVHLTASAVLVGPWGGDGTAPACGHCLALRWQRLRSRSERDALETGGPDGPRPTGAWPLLTGHAHDAVAALCTALLGDEPAVASPAPDPADRSLSQVSRLDLMTLQVRTYPVLADPLCPDCAPPATPARPCPLTLETRPKPDPGTYRLRAASAYPIPEDALANPVCGALGGGTWLNVTSPTTAPVAGSVFVRGYAGLNDVTWSGQENAFSTSRTLAFLEGLERYAGTHRRGRTTPVTGSWNSLKADAVDAATCGFYDPRTYRDDPLVDPFDPDRAIPWEWGWSLRDDRPVLVPSRLVYYSAGLAADNFVFECSNGCAIGGCLEEAVLGGLLELVERDAFLNAWYGNARLTEIDLATVGGLTAAMAERAALQGYDVHVLDNRVDLAIPVATAVAVRRDGGPGTLSFAAAASLDPRSAVEGALSEVLTYIPHLARQTKERLGELESMADDFHRVRHLKDHAQLYGLPRMATHARSYLEPLAVRPFDEVYRRWETTQRPRTGDLSDDVRAVVGELAAAGHDVIAVDQTTPEQTRMGLRTVSTLAPGLLPIDFGWNRQRAPLMPRLRTALRRGGHRTTDLADDEIRMVPHPFP